ncbi:hypothetical protein M422DRAFT_33121 [Sphaerobolus stellatus SS14]|uniref:Mitochondrial import inner membrane translocase subunit n=1 Tax=Sphaerobolus stellatus (strain SS14) TaxID=990650 RepID=A0A0C9UV17_SPHS4|nr:hypothetical protein M422DRAFT_33121 [Sphaerobolus stellatus SS14]
MSSFFGTPSSPPPPPPSRDPDAVKKISAAILHQNAIAKSQTFLNIAGDKCFLKCVTKPGRALTSAEETCLARCGQRYMEAFDMVSRTVTTRARQEVNNSNMD